jgi:hypothetical protein
MRGPGTIFRAIGAARRVFFLPVDPPEGKAEVIRSIAGRAATFATGGSLFREARREKQGSAAYIMRVEISSRYGKRAELAIMAGLVAALLRALAGT